MYRFMDTDIYTYKRKTELTETANFRLFLQTEIGNGRQTINGNRRLLCQQTCQSMQNIECVVQKGFQWR
jgi:hypothetical protein